MKRARLSPTPWWCDRLPPSAEHGSLAGVPQRDVRRLDLVGRRGGGEREVQAGAVGVAVRQVAAGRRGRAAPPAAPPRTSSKSAGEPGPRRGDLHRVDDEALAGQRLQRAGVVAVVHQPSTSSIGAGRAPAAWQHLVDDGHRGVDDRRVALVEHEQHALRAVAAVARGPTRRRRTGAARPAWRRARRTARQASRPSANDVERGTRRGCSAGGTGWARSQTRVMMPSVPSEPRNSWVRSGPTAAAGAPPVRTTRAVGQHHLQPDDHVLDLAVAGASTGRRRGRRPSRRRWRCRSSAGSGRR